MVGFSLGKESLHLPLSFATDFYKGLSLFKLGGLIKNSLIGMNINMFCNSSFHRSHIQAGITQRTFFAVATLNSVSLVAKRVRLHRSQLMARGTDKVVLLFIKFKTRRIATHPCSRVGSKSRDVGFYISIF